tara:strand:- start:161 stop:406 length:246 start_codon:yes stop_codon:yes gene_type:complete
MNIYFDLDGVLVDFDKARSLHPLSGRTPYIGLLNKLQGVDENIPDINEGRELVKQLLSDNNHEVYILSTAPWDNRERAAGE